MLDDDQIGPDEVVSPLIFRIKRQLQAQSPLKPQGIYVRVGFNEHFKVAGGCTMLPGISLQTGHNPTDTGQEKTVRDKDWCQTRIFPIRLTWCNQCENRW